MEKSTKKNILLVLKTIISLLLCISAVLCSLAATALGGARKYLVSDAFKNQVEELDLSSVTFEYQGREVTVSDYVCECADDYLRGKLPSYFPFINYAVDSILSSEAINSAVKEEVFSLVEYFVSSDLDLAKERLKNGSKITDNETLDPTKAETPVDAVKVYIRTFILTNIEKNLKISTDEVIVLLSKSTVAKYVAVAILSAVLLIFINRRTVFNILLYSGFSSIAFGLIIQIVKTKYESAAAGKERLIGFYILNPLAESFYPDIVKSILIGAVLLVIFIIFYFVFRKFINADSTENAPNGTAE